MILLKNSTIILFLITVLSVSSCGCNHGISALGTVQIIDSFPREYNISNEEILDCDLMGVVGMKTFGPLTIYITPQDSTQWGLASTSDHLISNRVLPTGAGPNEFLHTPSIIEAFHTHDTTIVVIKDSQTKKLYDVIVNRQSSSLDKISIQEKTDAPYAGYLKDTRWIIPISDSLTYICKYNLSERGFRRMTLLDNKLQDIQNLGTIQRNFNDIEDFNTLAFIPLVNPNGTDIAELMIRMNQINLYSLTDSTKRTTICVGKQLDDIYEVDERSRADRVPQYSSGEAFPNFFAALYSGQHEREINAGKGNPQLHFFDWNGKPLLCIKFNIPINSFHIDEDSGYIYGFSPYGPTEKLYKWDCRDILKNMTNSL